MDKKPLEDRIRDAFTEATPDILSRILDSVDSIETVADESLPEEKPRIVITPIFKKILVAAACLVLFVGGLVLGLFFPVGEVVPMAETSIYLDVNPSIELSIDTDGKVIECLAANEDAEVIIGTLELKGVDMNTALTALIGSMYINGYLSTDSNSILVSIDSTDDSKEDTLLAGVTEKITGVFEKSNMACSIIAQKVEKTKDLVDKAKEMGVSVGKMHLVDKMVGALDELQNADIGTLVGMSIKELDLIYSEKKGNESGGNRFDDDIKEGSSSGYDKLGAIALLNEYFGNSGKIIEEYEIEFKVNFFEKPSLVYEVEVKFVGDEKEYKYEFDCLTGDIVEITEDEDNEPPFGGSDHGVPGGSHEGSDGIKDYIDDLINGK